MSWLPDAPHLIRLLIRIEKEEDIQQDATELFWLFCTKSLSPDEFKDRVLFWIDKHLEDSPKGGGFIDPDVKEIILQGSERVTEIIADRLDTLCKTKRVPYLPDENDDPVALYISILLESSRLIRLLKTDGYSDMTREVLAYALNAFARFSRPKISDQNPHWNKGYSIFAKALGTFLYTTQFLIQKSDGEYEEAFKSLAGAIVYYLMADRSGNKVEKTEITESSLVEFINYITTRNYRELPWLWTLEPQIPVDCFEALRRGERISDLKNIAGVCELLVNTYDNWWILDPDEEVKDAEGNTWDVIVYWNRASAWLEARLQPSDLRELLNEREDSASEKRLRTYFFSDETWIKLPERVKSSLISADRDWFSGIIARKEAVFNELRIATEELLHLGLWKPIEQRVQNLKKHSNDTEWFIDRRQELSRKRLTPTLLDFERLCRLSITDAFLKEKGISNEERIWFCNQLPKKIYHLRRARNLAEHELGIPWNRQQLGQCYNDYIGIGQTGILPRLCKILFS